MKRFKEEDIYNYLDQTMTPELRKQFEQELNNNPELESAVEEAREAHGYFHKNSLEKAPEGLSDQVMVEVNKIAHTKYYRPSGLFSSTGFLLVCGVLTALVAFLSLLNTGYVDWQSMAPGMIESGSSAHGFLDGFSVNKKIITNSLVVIYGVLALVVLDKVVLNPLFKRRVKQLDYN